MFRYSDMECPEPIVFQAPDHAPDISRRSFIIKGGLAGITAILALNGCSSSDSSDTANTVLNSPDTVSQTTTAQTSPSSIVETSTSIPATTSEPNIPEQAPTVELLQQVGQSLINSHEDATGGWRFRSAIQAPHYQTDRDLGASSVGMGFLVAADRYPEDQEWLQAAEQTAGWLMAVAQTDNNGGVFWSDYVDDSMASPDIYTSFDDGALGIGDFFWQLYERTQNGQYKDIALATLRWTFAQAENVGNTEPVFRWQWNVGDSGSAYYMGMGEGAVGQVHTFATYYERLQGSDPELASQCQEHINGSLRYLDKVRADLGGNDGDERALPETGVIDKAGDTNMNSGYLSGAAGTAFMYLKLYKVFGDDQYLAEADKLFSWLEDTENGPMVPFNDGSVAWKLAIDPKGGGDPVLATGFEEGSAGIGWTYLQAYKLTGNERYLTVARQAADWLTAMAVTDGNGITWHEDEAPAKPTVHANLNNGAAGIGMFLQDLSEASGDAKYHDLAQQALNWLIATAVHDQSSNMYWNDNDGEADYSQDPSWHWGTAGIMAFIAKMSGGTVDIPGEQSGLTVN